MLKEQFSNQSGQVAVIVAILIVALVGMAAYVIDVGSLYATRRSLQTAADAAALAGAQELPDTDAAQSVVEDFNPINNESVGVIDINADTISVIALRHDLEMNFAQVLGTNSVDIIAYATAEIGSPSIIRPLSEMGYPLEYADYANYIVPLGLTGHYSPGDEIYLTDDNDIIGDPDQLNFYPLVINGPSTVIYEGNIRNGVDTPLSTSMEVGTYDAETNPSILQLIASSMADRVNQHLNHQWDNYSDITKNGNELAVNDSQFILCPYILPTFWGGPATILDFLPFIVTGYDLNEHKIYMKCLSKAILINDSDIQLGVVPSNGVIVIRLAE